VRCGLLDVHVGYLFSWHAEMGAFTIRCTGGCTCVEIPGTWSRRAYPFPTVQAASWSPAVQSLTINGQGKRTDELRNASLTLFTRFLLFVDPELGTQHGACHLAIDHHAPALTETVVPHVRPLRQSESAAMACDNTESADWCTYRIGLCNEEYVTERCRATCNNCSAGASRHRAHHTHQLYTKVPLGKAAGASHVRIDALGVELASCTEVCYLGTNGGWSARRMALRARTECAQPHAGYFAPPSLRQHANSTPRITSGSAPKDYECNTLCH
jgi:hypothetical protein